MSLQITYKKHTLSFKFEAGTSRGVLKERDTYYLKIWDSHHPQVFGMGEASPLKGLSIDDRPDFKNKIDLLCDELRGIDIQNNTPFLMRLVENTISNDFPALKFACETAFLDWANGGQRQVFQNDFYTGKKEILINGLIWMGTPDFMLDQIHHKLQQGFSCIKMKIGAIDFEQECQLLAVIRNQFSADKITLRVDANGAFSADEAPKKLEILAKYDLHSIEQPIQAHQIEAMQALCRDSPLPIALDEELIGKTTLDEKISLLNTIRPAYLILKPTLLGGFQATKQWIAIAEKMGIPWWMTSALESNVGLNAIAQFTAEFDNSLPQGLGTGGLYQNNIASPLQLIGEKLQYNAEKKWGNIF